MASLLTSSSFSRTSRTLSANQTVNSSFSSTPNTFAMMGIWLRFAFRSPRSILLYIYVSISNATQRWRWKSPCSSLSCFIFCPNTFIFSFSTNPCAVFYELFYELMPFSTNLCRFSTNFSTNHRNAVLSESDYNLLSYSSVNYLSFTNNFPRASFIWPHSSNDTILSQNPESFLNSTRRNP